MRTISFIYIQIILGVFNVASQTRQDIIENLKNHYASSLNFSCNLTYKYYDKEGEVQPKEILNGRYFKKDSVFRMEIGEVTNISTGYSYISINNYSQEIIISETTPDESAPPVLDVSELEKQVQSLEEVGRTLDAVTYRYFPQKENATNPLSEIQITISLLDWSLISSAFIYRNVAVQENDRIESKDAKIEVFYSEQVLNAPLNETLFDIGQFVIKEGEEYKGLGSYKNYTINQF